MEAQPLLYQRPIKLCSQAKLFDWIDRSRSQHLKQVRHLTLQLTDVEPSPSLDPNQPPPSAWSMYENELSRFDAAFRSLPGLTEITIVPPRIMHSQLLRGMYLSVLALIPRLHTTLKLLVIHDNAAALEVIKGLQALPKVIFKESNASNYNYNANANANGNGDCSRVKKEHSLSPRRRSPREKLVRIKVEGQAC